MSENKSFWAYPWSYKQNFLIFSLLGVLGVLLEIVSKGRGISSVSYPNNLIIISSIVIFISFIHIFFQKNSFIKWISSVQTAIASISVFVVVILFMGFIPQLDTNIYLKYTGLSHITNSWLYFFSSFSLLIVLGFTIAKRILPFNMRNFSFLMNHLGLWIIIVGASFGYGDLKRINIPCYYNKPIWYGYDSFNKTYDLPFALELLVFSIEDYHPEIVLVSNKDGKIVEKNKQDIDLKDSINIQLKDFNIKIEQYLSSSIKMGTKYIGIIDVGAAPSALLNINNGQVKGWIGSGSFKYPNETLRINDEYSLTMSIAQPKKYSSKLKLFSKYENLKEITIEVNKPVKVLDWELYQVSYDEEKGKWSDYSVIEAVRDPWLIITYIGIYMLLAGSVLLFWFGKK